MGYSQLMDDRALRTVRNTALFDELEKITAESEKKDKKSPKKEKSGPPEQGTGLESNEAMASPLSGGPNSVDHSQKPAPKEPVKDRIPNRGGDPSREANNLFGLPYHPVKRVTRNGLRQYPEPNAGAMSANRSQDSISAQSTANLSQGGAMYSATGPGGV